MSDYPSELSHRWKTQDGTEILIRPIRPEDAGIEKDFIHQLSPKSKYFRFFSGLMDLSPAMLERFTRIDYAHEMALIAVHIQDGKEVEIGVGRYAPFPDGKECEFAVVVDDAWHHRGIAFELMRELIAIAGRQGFTKMSGWILSQNQDMLQLCTELGFEIHPLPEDAKVMQAVKQLATSPPPESGRR